MNLQKKASRLIPILQRLKDALGLLARVPVPHPCVSVQAPVRRAGVRVPARPLQLCLAFSMLLAVLAGVSTAAWAGQAALPEGVPNIFDADVRAQFEPAGVINLRGNPDFPMLVLARKAGEQPQGMVLGLDARNGKDTWSLASDPIILIILFSDPSTISAVHLDAGFSEQGKPSGTYTAVENPGSLTLPDVFKAIAAAPVRTYM
jgi:hypothetical protein